jgi:hypothetical protein
MKKSVSQEELRQTTDSFAKIKKANKTRKIDKSTYNRASKKFLINTVAF